MRTVAGSKLLPPFFHLWHLCLCNHSLSSETLGRQRCKCHVCPGIQSPNTLEPASPAQSSLRILEASTLYDAPPTSQYPSTSVRLQVQGVGGLCTIILQ